MAVPSLKLLAGAGAFNPLSIPWHSAFWAEGPDFVALGLSNGASVATWPNETSEADAASATNRPTYAASVFCALNNQPAVAWGNNDTDRLSVTFNTPPSYPVSIVTIVNVTSFGTNGAAIHDGVGASNRNHLFYSGTNDWQMYAGGTPRTVAASFGAYLLTTTYSGNASNETLSVNGAAVSINADAGSQTATGFVLGNYLGDNPTFYGLKNGHIAFLGVYVGTVTSHALWPQFKLWAGRYGMTIT